MPYLQNCFLFSATLARGKGWVLVHPRAIEQVDLSRTITHPVSRPEAALLLVPLTFCFDRLRTSVKTHLQCHPSRDASQSTKTICSILSQKEAGRLPPPAEAGGFRRQ